MFRLLLSQLGQTGAAVSQDARVRPSRNVLVAERDGVTVLLDLRRSVYLGLDEIGTVAWREIESGASAESVTRRICEEYDAPADAVLGDMQKFLAELRARRLVVSA